MSDDADRSDNPLGYPERPEITRERAKRIADLAQQCGEIVARGAFDRVADAPGDGQDGGIDAVIGPSMEEVLVGDDLDATRRFFAAAKTEPIPAADRLALAADGRDGALDFSRFRARRIRQRLLALLDELVVAIEQRDLQAVWDVLDEGDACRCFPPAVREEALVIARLPATAFRPPARLYRYYHMLAKLADEPVEHEVDPDQLPIPLPGEERRAG
jgi:hypothetical protein